MAPQDCWFVERGINTNSFTRTFRMDRPDVSFVQPCAHQLNAGPKHPQTETAATTFASRFSKQTASLVENGNNHPAVTRKNDRDQTHPRPHRVSVHTGQASSCPLNRPATVSQWLRLITTASTSRPPAHHCAARIRQCATPRTLPCIFWPFRAGRSNGATGGLQRASLRGNADPTVHLPRAG